MHPPKSQIVTDKDLGALYFPAGDMVMAPIINLDGIWEMIEVKWLKENVRPGDSCINVGANVGYFAILISQLTGEQGSVFAFEANSLSATFRFDLHHSPSINLFKLKA